MLTIRSHLLCLLFGRLAGLVPCGTAVSLNQQLQDSNHKLHPGSARVCYKPEKQQTRGNHLGTRLPPPCRPNSTTTKSTTMSITKWRVNLCFCLLIEKFKKQNTEHWFILCHDIQDWGRGKKKLKIFMKITGHWCELHQQMGMMTEYYHKTCAS